VAIPIPAVTAFSPDLSGVTAIDFAMAVNDATAWLQARGGGRCHIPAGMWPTAAPVLLRPGVEVFGDWIATTISAAHGYTGNLIENAHPASGQNFSRHNALSDIRLNGVSRLASGVVLDHAAETFLDRVVIENCLVGVSANYSIVTAITRSKINANRRGVVAVNASNGFKVLNGTRVQASREENIIIDGPHTYGCAVRDSIIESSGIETQSAGILIGPGFGGVKGVVIDGNHIEANRCGDKGQIAFGVLGTTESDSAGAVSNNWVTGGAHSTRAVVINRSHGITVIGNDTAGHQVSLWLEASANGVKAVPGRVDDAAYLGGPGAPYLCADNGNLRIANDLICTAPWTQRIKKPAGSIAIEAPAGWVYVKDSKF